MKGSTITKINPVHTDERGSITDILNENVGHVGLITTSKGTVRGNHYHTQSIQYSYILSGKFEVTLARHDNLSEIEKFILTAGDLITLEPYVVHSFKAIEDNTVMIDIISKSREGHGYEDDVVKGIKLQ